MRWRDGGTASPAGAWSLPRLPRRRCLLPFPAPLLRPQRREVPSWGRSWGPPCLRPLPASTALPLLAEAACTGTQQRPPIVRAPQQPRFSRPRHPLPRQPSVRRLLPICSPAALLQPTGRPRWNMWLPALAAWRFTVWDGQPREMPRPQMGSLPTGAPLTRRDMSRYLRHTPLLRGCSSPASLSSNRGVSPASTSSPPPFT